MARAARRLLLALALLAYAVWGQFYIERTSFLSGDETRRIIEATRSVPAAQRP